MLQIQLWQQSKFSNNFWQPKVAILWQLLTAQKVWAVLKDANSTFIRLDTHHVISYFD